MSLAGWNTDKKIKLTIPAQGAALTDFPVLVNLSSASGVTGYDCTAVFDELDSSNKKIAFEIGDTGTQCYCEIERWDAANESAQLWVKVPSTADFAATILYLYYDSAHADNTSYVGDTGDAAAQSVWAADFAAVYHLSQDPSGGSNCILDSTANANHGTPQGSMTSGDLVDGLVGKGLQFDGVDDCISLPALGFSGDDTFTIESLVKADVIAQGEIFHLGTQSALQELGLRLLDSTGGYILYFNTDDIVDTGPDYEDTWRVVSASYSATGSSRYLYVDGAELSNDSPANPSFTDNNYYIGARLGSSKFFSGIIDEIRISSVERSADWIDATDASLRDELITFSEPVVLLLTALDQLYNLSLDQVIAGLVQEYYLTAPLKTALEQVWGLKLDAALIQRWSNAPLVGAACTQYYGDAHQVTQGLVQRWDDMVQVGTALAQQYHLMYEAITALEQVWAVTGTPVDQGLAQVWDLRLRGEVIAALAQPWNLYRGAMGVQAPIFWVLADGVLLAPSEFSWTLDEDQVAISCTVTLPDRDTWALVQGRGNLEIGFNGTVYSFFVEKKQRRRSIGDGGQYQVDYILVGRSITAALEAPYALPVTLEWPTATTARAIVEALAGLEGIAVDWQIEDFPVAGGTFFVNSETPLAGIRKIIGVVEAVVNSAPDGTLIVRREMPVTPGEWATHSADHTIADDGGLFADSDDRDITPDYNVIEISNQMSSDASKRLEEEQISSTAKRVRGFCVPWEEDFYLETSGGLWVSIQDNGVIIAPVVGELVEFVDGVGSLTKPVYSALSVTWLQIQLGVVSYAEDGSLVAEVAGNSLARISYTTKYREWIVRDAEIESVQCYIPGEEVTP